MDNQQQQQQEEEERCRVVRFVAVGVHSLLVLLLVQ